MVQITFKADATTTVDLPDWAPPIEYATTGSGSGALILAYYPTTSKDTDDSAYVTTGDIVSYNSTSIRLPNNLPTKPYVTVHYVAVGELTRTT